MTKDINHQNFFKHLLTLTPDTPDIFLEKFLLKKSKNISGISPGYPGYIIEGTNEYVGSNTKSLLI